MKRSLLATKYGGAGVTVLGVRSAATRREDERQRQGVSVPMEKMIVFIPNGVSP